MTVKSGNLLLKLVEKTAINTYDNTVSPTVSGVARNLHWGGGGGGVGGVGGGWGASKLEILERNPKPLHNILYIYIYIYIYNIYIYIYIYIYLGL